MGRKKSSEKKKDLSSGGSGKTPEEGLDCINSPIPYVCKTSDVYGRYLESRRDLKRGSLILSEQFLIAGPMRCSNTVCVGCSREPPPSLIQCPECSWPVCSAKCSSSIFHEDECKFFRETKIQAPNPGTAAEFDFGALTVLRGLLLKLKKPRLWETLLTLEHHNDIRREREGLWKANEEFVLKVLKDKWGVGKLFSDDEIHTVCGILEVNSFELGENWSFRGIFPKAAMMAHSCVPNVTHFEDPAKGVIDIRATVDIPAGSPLFFSYAYALQGTELRKRILADIKFFECACSRCKDPTELGSHMSTLICQKCRTGLVLNQGTPGSWACTNKKCRLTVSDTEVQRLCEQFETEAERGEGIRAQEQFIQRCSKYFHPNHSILMSVKYSLCQNYGREVPLHELSDADLERKSRLCSEVLKVLDIVSPGLTITRGLILHEFQAAELMLARRIFETRKYSKALLKRRIETAMKLLEEAIEVLELSHPSTDEYRISQISKRETLLALPQWLSSLK